MRKQFYLALIARLSTILDTEDKPMIKYFDLWNNQLSHLEEESLIDTPAVFIEFMPIKWRSLGNNRREANLSFNLHPVVTTKASPSSKSNYQSDALFRFDLVDEIHKKLRGWSPDRQYCGTILGTDSLTDHDHDELIDDVESFTCTIIDAYAAHEYTKVEGVDPVIKITT